ncbi:hypothetical protein [Pectinatus haikarae]|uniref:Uncharacterized protein n=1 Tax=Pectinatus haikarae TaxID=349096 RepID=A0ABT9Y5Z5_9FIRM|nr:hypothetical protein [Pectinatus haikarae]MDQ0203256.1 hypothetical protein [Pectinatus haikarae]
MSEESGRTVYGGEQNIKMALMQMINEGKDPYEIILYMADYLERISGEKGYKENVRDCIQSVYGIGLDEEGPLNSALMQVRQRCQQLETSMAGIEEEDVKKRILFAVEHHKKFAAFLENKIKKARDKH